MILVLGTVHAQIPYAGEVEQAMATAQRAAREQDGCLEFEFARSLQEPGRYVVSERWRDRDALDAHFGSEAFAQYQTAVTPFLVRESEVEIHVVSETFRPLNSVTINTDQDD